METDREAPIKRLGRKPLKTASLVPSTLQGLWGKALFIVRLAISFLRRPQWIWVKQACPAQTCPNAPSFLAGGDGTGWGWVKAMWAVDWTICLCQPASLIGR